MRPGTRGAGALFRRVEPWSYFFEGVALPLLASLKPSGFRKVSQHRSSGPSKAAGEPISISFAKPGVAEESP